MQTITHFDMHLDHKIWESEVGMWLEDLKFWEKEISQLDDDLKVIKSAISNHKEAAGSHKILVTQHQISLHKHESDMTIVLEGGELDKSLAVTHHEELKKHLQQKDAHERIKKYHHKVVALIKALRKALEHSL